MTVNKDQSEIIKKIIFKTNSEKLDNKFISDITPDISALLDINYFAALVFKNSNLSDNISISNNPQEFNDIYMQMIDQDFLFDNMIKTGKPVVFRDLIDKDIPHSADFIYETQKIRPVSDCCYVPIKINNTISGLFAVARAGLKNRKLSENDIDIFNFISSFLEENFRKTLRINTDSENKAYLNGAGEIIFAGSRIKNVFKLLFGEKYYNNPAKGINRYSKIFADNFRQFTGIIKNPGNSELIMRKNGYKYHFSFSILSSPEYRCLIPEEPQYEVSLIRESDTRSSILNLDELKENYSLTNRETEVIEYIYQGLSNREISEKLKTAESTVKRHVWNIFNKTGAENRTQLIFKLSL